MRHRRVLTPAGVVGAVAVQAHEGQDAAHRRPGSRHAPRPATSCRRWAGCWRRCAATPLRRRAEHVGQRMGRLRLLVVVQVGARTAVRGRARPRPALPSARRTRSRRPAPSAARTLRPGARQRPRQAPLDEVEPVLAPEQLAVDDVGRRAEHAGARSRAACPRRSGRAPRALRHPRGGAPAGRAPPASRQVGGVVDVALVGPHAAQHRAGQRQRRVGAVVLVDRDDQRAARRPRPGSTPAAGSAAAPGGRESAPARPAGRPGAAAGAWPAAARPRPGTPGRDRPALTARPRPLRDRGEARVAEVGPRRLRREVVVDRRAAHRRLSVAFASLRRRFWPMAASDAPASRLRLRRPAAASGSGR